MGFFEAFTYFHEGSVQKKKKIKIKKNTNIISNKFQVKLKGYLSFLEAPGVIAGQILRRSTSNAMSRLNKDVDFNFASYFRLNCRNAFT